MSNRKIRANMKRLANATRSARIKWHAAMDKRFNAYTDPRRNVLVCPFGKYDAASVFSNHNKSAI